MKFVALVSGGKDSIYNIAQCIGQGHELVALGNLFPRAGLGEEIDSYMFQTVGHRVVECLSECIGVPLYRRPISASENAVVDDLSELLKEIRSDIEFQGVSVGAIASTYQQLRVDKACQQVGGLVALCFLWQRDQCELLDELIESGLDVRIVKVAAYGLGQNHLGLSLERARDDLLRLHALYDSHPCGEGGEYETMVFNAPFFPRRMVMEEPRVVKHANDDVFYLSFQCHSETNELADFSRQWYQPPMFEPFFRALEDKLPSHFDESANIKWKGPITAEQFDSGIVCSRNRRFQTLRGSYEEVFQAIQDTTGAYYVAVILKNMESFSQFNEIYNAKFASLPNPPSRACIQADLPWEVELTIYCELESDPEAKGLHVQGRSFWAPANIGPYSQVRMVRGVSYVAGQIGLIPQTLQLKTEIPSQAVLALQNSYRLLNTMHGEHWSFRLAVVYTTSAATTKLAEHIWSLLESNVPLVVAEVTSLPRGAAIEWSFEAVDLKYFQDHRPYEDDDLDELYQSQPVIKSNASLGFDFQIGFQTLSVILGDTEETSGINAIISGSKPLLCVHWIPARRVRFSGKDVDAVNIASTDMY